MTFEISKTFRFEAAHYLPNVPRGHPCGRMHGHSYEVEICLRGEISESEGWVRDFADIKSAWSPLHGQLDHTCLNDHSDLPNPTAEALAEWVFGEIKDALPELSWVTISETRTSKATYRGAE